MKPAQAEHIGSQMAWGQWHMVNRYVHTQASLGPPTRGVQPRWTQGIVKQMIFFFFGLLLVVLFFFFWASFRGPSPGVHPGDARGQTWGSLGRAAGCKRKKEGVRQ